jgi:hypothetical protein
MRFGWSINKMTQYMLECKKPLLCEYTREELEKHREGLRAKNMSEVKIEEKISREIYEGKEKLTRRYQGYLGMKEDLGDSPVRVYRRWLRDVWGCSDEEVDELSEKEFSDSQSEEKSSSKHVKEEVKEVFDLSSARRRQDEARERRRERENLERKKKRRNRR